MIRQWVRPIVLGATAVAFVCLFAVSHAGTKFKVAVYVSAEDGSSNEMQSCINRELRTFGDVSLVSSDPRFTLSVVLMRPELGGGRTVGWVASMVILDHVIAQGLIRDTRPKSFSSYLPPETFQGTGDLASHYVMADPTVAGLCKMIVSNLDVDAIEGARRVNSAWVEAAEEISNEKPE